MEERIAQKIRMRLEQAKKQKNEKAINLIGEFTQLFSDLLAIQQPGFDRQKFHIACGWKS